MAISKTKELTELADVFLLPANATHRQYEALRAYFVEGLSFAQAAARFGYTPGSFRVLVHEFRQNPQRAFFQPPAAGRHAAPADDPVRRQIVLLRKQNYSVYDIQATLRHEGVARSIPAIAAVLREEGFARLPRRRDEERPAVLRPTAADKADVRQFDLSPRSFRTSFGGLFLFLPALAQMHFDHLMRQAGLPGSELVPAACAMRALLALKLFGTARRTHVMSAVLDEGLALFAGLNAIPKRSFLTEYRCRIAPACYPELMRRWFDALKGLGQDYGRSFDLDFHTLPFHGEDALVEKHDISKRSRRQKGMLAFLAQDAKTRVFCYVNGELRKDQQNDEVLRFVEYWRQRTGRAPEELIFDSKLTTYANLNELNRQGVKFITLRRRGAKQLEEIARTPRAAWRRIELEGVSREYRTPRLLDRQVTLPDYKGPLRQLTVADLGHEQPTLLLTNHLRTGAPRLIERYARRMLIENNLEDSIDFFHLDALSTAVAMKVNCDLHLTLMASSLYRHLATTVGHGYETAKSRHLFRDFVEASARVQITDREVLVRYQKRAHNPFLLAAGFDQGQTVIPWWSRKRLRFLFG